MQPIGRIRRLVNRPRVSGETGFSRVLLVQNQKPTVGDQLSAVIVGKVLAYFNHTLDEETRRPARLLTVGADLVEAGDGDVVWGAGVGGAIADSEYRFRTLDVRAVRGPITRELLQRRGIAVPETYADPTLLLPRLFPGRFRASGRRPYALVPGLADPPSFAEQGSAVSPLLPWNTCVERILEASFVISSTLHGLAIADAFGIPVRHIRLGDERTMSACDDYLLGTGRSHAEPASSIEQALEMGALPPPIFNEDGMLAAFPIDLWRDGGGAMGEDAAV